METHNLAQTLFDNQLAVIPTDTIYGIVGRAAEPDVVEKIYRLKGRDYDKPFIILISSLKDLELFDISLNEEQREYLATTWPGPVSVILPCPGVQFEYLHRGKESLAFRLPDVAGLRTLIAQTGPLVAPSANPQGMPPAATIQEAREYFGESVSVYLDAGHLDGVASRVVSLIDGEVEVVRG